MLTAWDVEKEATRDFAWQDMKPVQNGATSAAVAAQRATPAPVDALVKAVEVAIGVMERVDGENDCSSGIDALEAALAALAAQGVRVKPLAWELQAGKEGPYYSAFDPLYGRQVESPDEQTCDAIDRNRVSHILAAIRQLPEAVREASNG